MSFAHKGMVHGSEVRIHTSVSTFISLLIIAFALRSNRVKSWIFTGWTELLKCQLKYSVCECKLQYVDKQLNILLFFLCVSEADDKEDDSFKTSASARMSRCKVSGWRLPDAPVSSCPSSDILFYFTFAFIRPLSYSCCFALMSSIWRPYQELQQRSPLVY